MLRESYRINKHHLTRLALKDKREFRILFTLTPESYDSFRMLNYSEVLPNMADLLKVIEENIE